MQAKLCSRSGGTDVGERGGSDGVCGARRTDDGWCPELSYGHCYGLGGARDEVSTLRAGQP